MRKFIKILLIAIVLLPLRVFADMGAPAIMEYNASVSVPEGAKYYDSKFDESKNATIYIEKGTIQYGKEIHVTYEEVNNNEKYALFSLDKEYFLIKVNDIISISNEIDFNDEKITKVDGNYKGKTGGVILKKDGIKIYKGPAYGYGETKYVIPFGEKIDFKYVMGFEGVSWAYVEYKGHNGWISTLDGAIGFDYIDEFVSSTELIFSYKTDITDVLKSTFITNNSNFKTLSSIDANNIIKPTAVYRLDPWSRGNLYIEYGNNEGYIESNNLVPNCSENCSVTIQDGYNSLYKDLNYDEIGSSESKSKITSEKIIDIPTNTEVKMIYFKGGDYGLNYIGYIEYGGKKGWIEVEYEYYQKLYNPNFEIATSTTTTTTSVTTVPTTTKNSKSISKKKTSSEFIIICVFSAVIVSITSLVIIMLINKRKKLIKNVENNINTEINNQENNINNNSEKKM